MNILLIDSESRPYIDSLNFEQTLAEYSISLTYIPGISHVTPELLQVSNVVIVYFGNNLTENHIKHLKRCKGIVAATSGFNNIDINAAREQGIPVCNIPDYGYEDVADHTLSLILGCVRKLYSANNFIRQGSWNWHSVKGSFRLKGKNLGIIGLGRIGSAVADRALAFGLNVKFYDPYVAQPSDSNIKKIDDLEVFLSSLDILSINCPLTKETEKMINMQTISYLSPHAIIVNTARGSIIEQSALITALKNKKIAGAGLDVLEKEPSIPEELVLLDNVILTPHSAFYTIESLELMRKLAFESALNFLQGNLFSNSIVNEIGAEPYVKIA